MWRPGQPERCAFCGRSIEPGEERVGRGESAAHAACADAALGDDRLWEGVGGDEGPSAASPAAGGGDGDVAGTGPAATGGRGGCAMLMFAAVAVVAVWLSGGPR